MQAVAAASGAGLPAGTEFHVVRLAPGAYQPSVDMMGTLAWKGESEQPEEVEYEDHNPQNFEVEPV